MAENRRRWLGRQVWFTTEGTQRRQGTIWAADEDSVVISENGVPGVLVFPTTVQGSRWDFVENGEGIEQRDKQGNKGP